MLLVSAGTKTVVDIEVIMDSFTMDIQVERCSARLSQLVTLLVLASITEQIISFSRKILRWKFSIHD